MERDATHKTEEVADCSGCPWSYPCGDFDDLTCLRTHRPLEESHLLGDPPDWCPLDAGPVLVVLKRKEPK